MQAQTAVVPETTDSMLAEIAEFNRDIATSFREAFKLDPATEDYEIEVGYLEDIQRLRDHWTARLHRLLPPLPPEIFEVDFTDLPDQLPLTVD